MNSYTEQVQAWLNQRFSRDAETGDYHAHEPIYGFGQGNTESGHLIRFARTLKILRLASQLEFENALDVGGGEGYLAHLVRGRFGAYTVTSDLSLEANRRAKELYNLRSVGIYAGKLPFKDRAFDLVICSEVLEHVEDAVDAVQELDRVTRKYLIITTLEACPSKFERRLRLRLRDFSHPHYEINWWHPNDFVVLLRSDIFYTAQVFVEPSLQFKLSERMLSTRQAMDIVSQMTREMPFGSEGTCGIFLLKKRAPIRPTPSHSDQELIDYLFSDSVKSGAVQDRPGRFDDTLLDYLCCPSCRGELYFDDRVLYCSQCNASYPVEHGIPLLYPGSLEPVDSEPKPIGALRRSFYMNNVAKSKFERSLIKHALGYYYTLRSFRSASNSEKARKIMRHLKIAKNLNG